jgi:hypothetical protein
MTFKSIKVQRPDRYGHIILLPGGMHESIHTLVYAGQHSYSECLTMNISDAMGFKKIDKRPQDLEQDKADAHKNFLLAIACCCKFLLIQKYGATMTSKRMQTAVVASGDAGDMVMFFFNLQVGEQLIKYQHATRASQGNTMDACKNWMAFLGWANHKTTYNRVHIIRALARYCTHPAIQKVIVHKSTCNMNGRVGTDFHIDDDIENLNKDVQEYAGKVDSPSQALIYTEYFDCLKQVDGRYRELMGVDNETPLQMRSSFVTTTNAILAWMQERIELFKDEPARNPFNGHLMESGDYRREKPWEHIQNCAFGEASPIGFGQFKSQSYTSYIENYIQKHLWDMGQAFPRCESDSESEESDFGGE